MVKGSGFWGLGFSLGLRIYRVSDFGIRPVRSRYGIPVQG